MTDGEGEGRTPHWPQAARAGRGPPIGGVTWFFEAGKYGDHAGSRVPVYLSAVLQYLVSEVLEVAGNAARDNKKNRIVSRYIQLAVRNEEELSKHLDSVTISNGGVLPNIH